MHTEFHQNRPTSSRVIRGGHTDKRSLLLGNGNFMIVLQLQLQKTMQERTIVLENTIIRCLVSKQIFSETIFLIFDYHTFVGMRNVFVCAV